MLADDGVLRDISETVAVETLDRYMDASLAGLKYKDRVYGLPATLDVMALYYNKRLVDTPPATLDALLAQAADGATVLISTGFPDVFWGVQAFGGR